MEHASVMNRLAPFFCLLVLLSFSACSSSSKRWEYRYERGKTAKIVRGHAVPPSGCPDAVVRAIEAGNRLVGKPYKYGGGHGRFEDSGYDCSGTVSYVLHAMGKLDSPTTSSALRDYGKSGEGKWVTIYAEKGHTFIEVAGLRLDTGYHGMHEGPRWTTKSRPIRKYEIRHPSGL